MTMMIQIGGLSVAQSLVDLVEREICPGTGISAAHFWRETALIVAQLGPINRELLQVRDRMQAQLDRWHQDRVGQVFEANDYRAFLVEIGYLQADVDDFQISTGEVDPEIAELAGPQLVVPLLNARFALNAANARWGSLFDALYGTDAIPYDQAAGDLVGYNRARGSAVIAAAKAHLDCVAPLRQGNHAQAQGYRVDAGELDVLLLDGQCTGLVDPATFVGFTGPGASPQSILLRHHGLHVEIQIDRQGAIGAQDLAGVQDLWVEAALSTIMDCEDSVAAVDAEDKVALYRNWQGLMTGDLRVNFRKAGQAQTRRLATDRTYNAAQGGELTLVGRSLMFIRHVGHHMLTDAVLDAQGDPIPESILDGMITSLSAIHDLQRRGNSRTGSIYVVKPKLHGPAEVAFAVKLFGRIEQALGLAENTLKIGIMDEERRTSVNLKACIYEARQRLVFINTGFLDRSGDEIHTSRHAGVMVPKAQMKQAPWLAAYEQHNVAVGLACGLAGRAQIGKGMWAMPDEMAAMLRQKIVHPMAGASTAWVPSPTGAVLHSLHYHQVDVGARQQDAQVRQDVKLDELLSLPLLANPSELTARQIQQELDGHAQAVLGYVVRWVEQGIGCSTVPDINNMGLMEDRATLRIASQHLANWLLQGVIDRALVLVTLEKMARIVDGQNCADPLYRPMGPNYHTSLAFQAASALILNGSTQPNGYTEPLLHAYRRQVKARSAAIV